MKSLLDRLRTLLILGRVSNLPTVWSNLVTGCIAAWVMNLETLALVLIGGSFLYIGGMYLNDFCDAAFDARYCPARPIPAGKISQRTVGLLATLWFAAGLACLMPFGHRTALIALLLLAAIVLYDFHHKNVAWAPLLMGACRFLLYPLAFSAMTARDLSGALVTAAPLGLYVAGITYLARGESRAQRKARWALLLLLSPLAMPYSLCVDSFFVRGFVEPFEFFPSLLLLGWMSWLLVPFWRKTNLSIGRIVSGLLAGIVLVDVIPVAPFIGWQAIWFLVLFILALLLQRVIPAT